MSYGFQVKGLGCLLQFINGGKVGFGYQEIRKGVYFRGAKRNTTFCIADAHKVIPSIAAMKGHVPQEVSRKTNGKQTLKNC